MGNQQSTVDAIIAKSFPPLNSHEVNEKADAASIPKLEILAFEAAATMQKALELWDVLQPHRLVLLRRNLEMEGIQKLVCPEKETSWRLAGAEREKDLQVLIAAAVTVGRKSRNPEIKGIKERLTQLLSRNSDLSPGDLSTKELDALLQFLRDMVSSTSNLHSELNVLDNLNPRGLHLWVGSSHPLRISRLLRDMIANENGRGNANRFNSKVQKAPTQEERWTAQLKVVDKLKANSLWVFPVDKLVQILVVVIYVIRRRFVHAFGYPVVSPGEVSDTLGAAGLALHYAHLLTAINKMVNRPTLVLRSAREELYHKAPTHMKRMLKERLKGKAHPFDAELAAELRGSMEGMLVWVMPVAHNTLVWQQEHSFGQHFQRRTRVLRVQTLFCAKVDLVEMVILELVVGLSYIVRPVGAPAYEGADGVRWRDWVASGGLSEPRTGFTPVPPPSLSLTAQAESSQRRRSLSAVLMKVRPPASAEAAAAAGTNGSVPGVEAGPEARPERLPQQSLAV